MLVENMSSFSHFVLLWFANTNLLSFTAAQPVCGTPQPPSVHVVLGAASCNLHILLIHARYASHMRITHTCYTHAIHTGYTHHANTRTLGTRSPDMCEQSVAKQLRASHARILSMRAWPDWAEFHAFGVQEYVLVSAFACLVDGFVILYGIYHLASLPMIA